jgi:hypothetical protein
MPTVRLPDDAQGRPRWARLPFRPEDFQPPPGFVERLRRDNAGYGAEELLAEHGGPFAGMTRVRDVERDGKRFALLWSGGSREWGLELELTAGELGEIRVLSPEEGLELAREMERRQLGAEVPLLGPLHAAVARRSADEVRAALAAGADANGRDPGGRVPLEYLLGPGGLILDGATLAIAEALARAGADATVNGVGERLVAEAERRALSAPMRDNARQLAQTLKV